MIGTGTTIEVWTNGKKIDTYNTLIYGDVDGDGLIDLNDLVCIKDHLTEAHAIDDTFKAAGDLYGEGNITLNDLVGVMAYISEFGDISQVRYQTNDILKTGTEF